MNNNYPEKLVRGVSVDNDQFITSQGYPTQAVFRFSPFEENQRSGDQFCELSINWVDDEGAIDTLLTQRNVKKGKLQFQGGYCVLSKAKMLLTMETYIENGHFSFERKPVGPSEENNYRGNPYHGNLLIHKELNSAIRTNIQATLATIAGTVIRKR